MVGIAAAIKEAIDGFEPHADGRRQRSLTSRRAILRAMMELLAEGETDPSADRVAERAGIGVRSVFRHFDDKEGLYREMNTILTEAYREEWTAPYKSEDWRDQLLELVERRAKVYEEIAPYRIPTSVQRFNLPVLMENYKRLLKTEHAALYSILPDKVLKDQKRTRAILLATSFDSWRLFRQDEELSNKKTIEVIQQLVQDILDQIDA
ncbi:MAG: TetR/AcrR family transcriptional regulator [Erythrobacter sp.]|nr:TetR/AcrR family transcriptional regulator [Erythrobacter sp.]